MAERGVIMSRDKTRVADDEAGKLSRQWMDVFRRVVYDRSLSVEEVSKKLRELLGNKIVPVGDYDWEEMIEILKERGCGIHIHHNFDFKNNTKPFSDSHEKRDVEINLRKNKRLSSSGKWLNILDKKESSNEKFAHPLVLISLIVDSLDHQIEGSIFTLWYDDYDQLWSFCFGKNDEDRYLLDIHCSDFYETRWYSSCRAVTVAK